MKEKRSLDLSERLLRYSAVASLTASGVLALGPGAALADPEVVAEPEQTLNPGDTLAINFDGGDPEFTLRVTWMSYTYTSYSITYTSQYGYIDAYLFHQSVSFLGDRSGTLNHLYPKVLNQGSLISSGAGTWGQPQTFATLTTSGTAGYWLGQDGTEKKYLGVRYQSGGETRYGWVELTCTSQPNGGPQLIVHRYGHNTTAGAGIPAAVRANSLKTTSGLRAVGAAAFAALAGVLTWIRRKIARG